jgi:hypothetical protein
MPVTAEAKEQFRVLVDSIAHECADELIRKKLVKRPAIFKRKLKVEVKNINRCWGGLRHDRRGKSKSPVISISTKYIDKAGLFKEYSRIAKDLEIGSFYSSLILHHIQAVVCHEIAHAADYWSGDRSRHGSEWRYRYRTLRRYFGLTLEEPNEEIQEPGNFVVRRVVNS